VRLFVGNLGNEINDQLLSDHFRAYPSFAMARVVREKRSGKSKGFGFASFLEPNDAMKAFRDKHGACAHARVDAAVSTPVLNSVCSYQCP
jgi:RNA recognition motif-containing protein